MYRIVLPIGWPAETVATCRAPPGTTPVSRRSSPALLRDAIGRVGNHRDPSIRDGTKNSRGIGKQFVDGRTSWNQTLTERAGGELVQRSADRLDAEAQRVVRAGRERGGRAAFLEQAIDFAHDVWARP